MNWNCKHPKVKLDGKVIERCPDCGLSLLHTKNFVKVSEKIYKAFHPKEDENKEA